MVGAKMAAQRHEPSFEGCTADQLFIEGWRKALEDRVTNKAIQQKAEKILTRMRELSKPVPKKPHSKIKAKIKSLDMNGPFEMHKRKFFMLDLFPEVEEELTWITLPVE